MEDKSLGRSFLILSIAGILMKVLSAVYMPILRGILGWEGYAIYSASYNWFIFIFALTTMGAQPAVTKVVKELKTLGHHKDALRTMKIARKYLFFIGLIFTLLFLALSGPIASISNSKEAELAIKFLAPTIVVTTVLSAYRGYLQGLEDMKTLAVSQVIEQLINVILSLIFAYLLLNVGGNLEWGSAGGTVGTSIGALVALIYIYYIYVKKDYEYLTVNDNNDSKIISDKKILKKLIKYGLPITLVAGMQNAGGVVDTINVQSRLLVSGFSQSEAQEMFGMLTGYNTLLYVPLSIVTALSVAIFPKIIEAYTVKNKKELESQITYSFKITYLLTIPAAVGLSLLSKEIYITIFGDSKGHELLMYGSVVLILMSVASIQNTILQGANRLYFVLKISALGLAIKFIINYVLISVDKINILGAVIASIFAFLIPVLINKNKINKLSKINFKILESAKMPIIASIFMGLFTYLSKRVLLRGVNILDGGRVLIALVTLIAIGIGGLVYLIVMIKLKALTKRDLDLISPKIYELMPKVIRKMIK